MGWPASSCARLTALLIQVTLAAADHWDVHRWCFWVRCTARPPRKVSYIGLKHLTTTDQMLGNHRIQQIIRCIACGCGIRCGESYQCQVGVVPGGVDARSRCRRCTCCCSSTSASLPVPGSPAALPSSPSAALPSLLCKPAESLPAAAPSSSLCEPAESLFLEGLLAEDLLDEGLLAESVLEACWKRAESVLAGVMF